MMKLFLLIFFVSTLTWADGGSMDGGGGDLHSYEHGAMWFLGSKPIEYCVEAAADFPLDKNAIKDSVETSFRIWKEYSDEKNIFSSMPLLHFTPTMVLHYNENCASDTELTFYAGIENAEVVSAKKLYENPVAFAHRISYDLRTGRARGIVWFSKHQGHWTKYNLFQAMMLHEVGHVLGNEHLTGTIMTPYMSEIVTTDWDQPNRYYYRWQAQDSLLIDHGHELVSKQLKYDSRESMTLNYDGLIDFRFSTAKNVFQSFAGRPAVGKIQAKLKIEYASPMNMNAYTLGTLTLIDEQSSASFPFILEATSVRWGMSNFFKYAFQSVLSSGNVRSIRHAYTDQNSVTYGAMTLADGSKLPVILEYNMLNAEAHRFNDPDLNLQHSKVSSPYQLFFFDGVNRKRLFGPSAYWSVRNW